MNYLPILRQFLLARVQHVVAMLFGATADGPENSPTASMQPAGRDVQL